MFPSAVVLYARFTTPKRACIRQLHANQVHNGQYTSTYAIKAPGVPCYPGSSSTVIVHNLYVIIAISIILIISISHCSLDNFINCFVIYWS